jgi:eukaryotic-like serine/threonine-protein kinase
VETSRAASEQDTLLGGADDLELARQRASLRRRLFGEQAQVVLAGRYALVERIGAGGMGTVYRAHDAELDRDVAIKLLRGHPTDGTAPLRLLRESRALAQLAHPHVVAIFDVVDLEGDLAIVMELVRGRSLRQWAAEDVRSDREILSVYVQAGRGLAAAHAVGLVHRDFKPDNAMVGDDGRVRVMDFGLALASSSTVTDGDTSGDDGTSAPGGGRLTRTGAVVGTPAYMAPEQFGSDPIDARADQFAFCVSLWEHLFGERPYPGDTPVELARNVAEGRIRLPASSQRAGALRRILERGLRPDPDERWPDLASLLDAIEQVAARRRRRILVTAAVVMVTGFGGERAAAAIVDENRRAGCRAQAEGIEQVWNDASRVRLTESVTGSALQTAETSLEHALPVLDEYVAQWEATYAELCVATEVDGARSAELWAASRACLSDRRSSLDVLLDTLSDAPSEVAVMGMVASVIGLDRIEPCESDAAVALAFDEGRPSDPDTEALRHDLRRLRALESTGKYVQAAELAARLLAATAQHSSARLRVEVLDTAGRVAEARGDFGEAQELLGRAFDEALRAGEDDLAFRAASALLPVVGDGRGSIAEAHVWARVASGLESRLGAGGDLGRALLHGNLGNLFELDAKPDKALEEHEKALTIFESVLGSEHPYVAVAHHGVGGALHSLGRYEDARAAFTRALDIFQRTYGPHHPHVGRTLNNLGNQAFALGRLDEAQREYERACDVLAAALGGDHVAVAMARVNLADVYGAQGRLEQAERVLSTSLERIEGVLGSNHHETARARRHLADLYERTGRTEEAARLRAAGG